jgi:predicted metalloprotease
VTIAGRLLVVALVGVGIAGLRPLARIGAQGPVGDRDADGIGDAVDACPLDAETANGFSDRDGCPDSVDDLLEIATGDLDEFWLGALTDEGVRYLPPDRVHAYLGGEDTGCGTTDLSTPAWSRNARYCQADHSIYLDHAWMDEEMSTGGDFAPVTILAHEWGHLVQTLEGLREDFTIQAELQADCLSGAYAQSADRRGMLEPGDLQEGLNAAFRSGNYDVPWNDPDSHGTPPQRLAAFFLGYQGSVDACGDVRSGELGSIIGIPAEERPEGSLVDQIPAMAGSFALTGTVKLPEMLQRGAIDAILATYRNALGAEVLFQVAAYGSEETCRAELETLRDSLVRLGYTVVEDAAVLDPEGVEIGKRYRLSAHNEILIWSSGTALGGIEAADYETVQQFVTDMLASVGPA